MDISSGEPYNSLHTLSELEKFGIAISVVGFLLIVAAGIFCCIKYQQASKTSGGDRRILKGITIDSGTGDQYLHDLTSSSRPIDDMDENLKSHGTKSDVSSDDTSRRSLHYQADLRIERLSPYKSWLSRNQYGSKTSTTAEGQTETDSGSVSSDYNIVTPRGTSTLERASQSLQYNTPISPTVFTISTGGGERFSDPWYDPLIERSLVAIQHQRAY